MGTTTETVKVNIIAKEDLSQKSRTAAREVNKLDNAVEGLGQVGQVTGGRIGELTGKLEPLLGVATKLGAPGAILAGTAVAIAGVGVAAVAASVALVAFTRDLRGEMDVLVRMGQVTKADSDAIEDLNVGLDAVTESFKALKVVLVTDFAAPMEVATAVVVGLILALGEGLPGAITTLGERAELMKSLVLQPVRTTFAQMITMAELAKEALEGIWGGNTEDERGYAKRVTDRVATFNALQSEITGLDMPAVVIGDSLGDMFSAPDLLAKGREFIDAYRVVLDEIAAEDADSSTPAPAQKFLDLGEAVIEATPPIWELNRALKAQAENLEALAGSYDFLRNSQLSATMDNMDATKSQLDAEKSLRNSAFMDQLGIFGGLSQAAADFNRDNIALQKTAAITSIVINTAEAISSVWAKYAAAPPVAIGLSAGVAAVGGAQIAAVLSANGNGAASTNPAFTAPTTESVGPQAPGDLQGGGTFIVLGNDIFDAATSRALRRNSTVDRP